MTDNKKIAEQVLRAVGGAANLKDATHCMTRLRLYLKDDSVPKDDEVRRGPVAPCPGGGPTTGRGGPDGRGPAGPRTAHSPDGNA